MQGKVYVKHVIHLMYQSVNTCQNLILINEILPFS